MLRLVRNFTSLSIAVLLILSLAPFDSAARSMVPDLDLAQEEAVRLSVLEAQGDAAGLYRTLHPDAQELISQKTVEGWYENEFFPLQPKTIIEITSVQLVSWTWGVTGKTYDQTAEISFVQPFGTGVDQYYVNETVRLVQSTSGQWSWFFGRSREFVDQQQAIYDPGFTQSKSSTITVTRTSRESTSNTHESSSRSHSSTVSTTRTAPSHPRSTATCTLVELAPGYPGYRGLVTGLSPNYGGLADWACLELLVRDNPGFDRDEQDRLNHEAAQSLGISGGPTDWLWENWMAIEAHRGLPTSCYSCLMSDQNLVPINTSITQERMDPRIQVGLIGSNSAINTFLPSAQMRSNFQTNYEIRVIGFLVKGPSANAHDIIDVYEQIANEDFWPSFDLRKASEHIYDVGGYSWVSGDAYPNDQIFSIAVAFFGATFQLVPPAQSSVLNQLDSKILEWRADLATGSTESLADFLRREFPL